jgi:predicted permease
MLLDLRSNLRQSWRTLLRERGVTVVAVGSLAIGLAANATIFSLIQAVMFPALVYPDASRLVFFESQNARGLVGMPVSAPDARDLVASARSFQQSGLTADQSSVIGEGASRSRVGGRRVEATFFEAMQVPAALGRVLVAADVPGVIVLGDDLWRRQFGADPSVVGRTVRLDGGTVTVVGVMPPRFDADADFWTPLESTAAFRRDDRQFTLFARLAPGATLEAAALDTTEVSARLAAAEPATNRDWSMYPTPVARMHGRDAQSTFLLLQAAVGCVLLIACANIANILLARGTRRRHEMALRVSLGAGRARLIAQLLTEGVLIAVAGGVLGLLLAMWGIRVARAAGVVPGTNEPSLGGMVLTFTALLSMLTGILCSIVPALQTSRVAPEAVLRAQAGRGGSGQTRGRLRASLVALQIGAAVVLATGGVLMLQTLANRARVNLGFDPRHAVRADLTLAGDRYRDPAVIRSTVDTIFADLARQPGVAAAGAITWALPTAPGAVRVFTLPAEGDTSPAPGVRQSVEAVTPDYFTAIGAPMRAGRAFTSADTVGAAPVAIVNEELAARFWPGRSPIGQDLRLGAPADNALVVTVVGVVSAMRRSAMHDVLLARAYVPFAQHPNTSLTPVVRGRTGSAGVARDLQTSVLRADPALMVEGLRTVEEDVAQFVAPVRLVTTLLTAFGFTGVLLAALGVFGTMSYVVSLREREMAVRSALGANRRDLLRLVLGNGLALTAVGLVTGGIAAVLASRALVSYLYGVTPTDPATLAGVVIGVSLVALGACYQPARSASRVDPMTILRRE